VQVLNDPQTRLLQRLLELAGGADVLHRAFEAARVKYPSGVTLQQLIALILREKGHAGAGEVDREEELVGR